KVFLERLKVGRKIFIERVLQPEIKKLCKDMGFKNYPKAFFEEVDLQDEVKFHRIWTRLLELGILTPEQTFTTMKTGVLPDEEELDEAQKAFVKKRKDGYFNPLVGGVPQVASPNSSIPNGKKPAGAPNPNASNNGRPAGSTSPKSTVSPIGTSN